MGQTFRIRHFENSQTPPSGRNRYEVISAMLKKAILCTNGPSWTKSYNGTLFVKWSQTFRIRHLENSQTLPSGRNRYEVISAMLKEPFYALTDRARPKVTMEHF